MVLVDSSVWVEYFRGNEAVLRLDTLIENNDICINDLILAELVPSIVLKKEDELKELLMSVASIPLDIDWKKIMDMQIKNLRKGINNVGIADLIIAQNAIDNGLVLYTVDRHFPLMVDIFGLRLYG